MTTRLVALEDCYQHFLQRRVDALLSSTRHEQWQKISGGEAVLEISPMDKEQNRRIARLAGVVVTGVLAKLYTPLASAHHPVCLL